MADEPSTPDPSTDAPATDADDATDQSTDTRTETPAETPDAATLAAELETWKRNARKHEDRAKANANAARELEALKRQGMSDTDRAVREAVDAALAEARTDFGSRLVEAEVRGSAQARGLNAEALLEGLDRSRFLTDDGEPDTKALNSWLDKLAPKKTATSAPDMGQGRRGSAPPKSKADSLGDFFAENFPA
jgi:hypothetical protein